MDVELETARRIPGTIAMLGMGHRQRTIDVDEVLMTFFYLLVR